MSNDKTIGLIFIEGFADWEFGFLSASVGEWFPGRVVALSPEGKPVRSIGRLMLTPDRKTDPGSNGDLDAVAVIGSDGWAAAGAPDVSPLLNAVAARGGVVGGICAGTLALARAGLFAKAAHTSNGRDWISGLVPDYAGKEHYRDVPQAVTGGMIISAPGSAPGTFATEFLRVLHPGQEEKVAEMKAIFAKEYAG